MKIHVLSILLILFLGTACDEDGNPVGPDHSNNDDGVETLRVFNWNIQHGRGMDEVVDIQRQASVIRMHNPHVVMLQEVDVGVERSGEIDIMAILADELNMEPLFHKLHPHQGGDFGNGMLTNLPVASSRDMLYDRKGAWQRGLQEAEVVFEGDTIVVMNTHLDNESQADRENSVEQIIENKQDYTGLPVILAGDMNARPDNSIIERLEEHFVDVWQEIGEGSGYTARPGNLNRRIDYIFFSNRGVDEDGARLEPVSIEVVETMASDHLPISAQFEVIR